MNKLYQARYPHKIMRPIAKDTGECGPVWIGKGTASATDGPNTVGVTLTYTAPDGKQTSITISDSRTLTNLAEMIASVQHDQSKTA